MDVYTNKRCTSGTSFFTFFLFYLFFLVDSYVVLCHYNYTSKDNTGLACGRNATPIMENIDMSKLDITFSPELIDRIALAHEQIELDSVNQSKGNKQYVLNL